ncbi:MAG: hypothetical protein AAGB14_05605 [Verrucomicrobiota bacterium]
MKRGLLYFSILLIPTLPGQEEDVFDPYLNAPKMIRVQFEYVEVSQQDYLELMGMPRKGADATPIRKRLQHMVAKGEAKVVETGMVVCRSGEKATAESIGERIYESEYEPSGLSAFPNAGLLDHSVRSTGFFPLIQRTPTSFETRNTGHTIEVAPNIGAWNRVVEIQLVPELVHQVGEAVHFEDLDVGGQKHQIRYPIFSKHSVNTGVTCIDGQYHLLSTVTPTGADGELDPSRKLMIFVKCDILVVKETEE